MECAFTFDVWKYYGTSVTAGAQGCGLAVNPSPSGWTPTITTTTVVPEPSAEPSTTEPPVVVDPSTTEPPVVASSEEPAVSASQPPAVPSDPPVVPSEPPVVDPSEPPVVASSEPPVVASSEPASEPSASGNVPYPVPSAAVSSAPYPDVSATPVTSEDCDSTTVVVTVTSTEDCETTTAVHVPVGNHTTLYPVPSKSGSVPSHPAASLTTTHTGAQPTESFVASGAAQLVGSVFTAGAVVAAMLAAF